MDMKQCPKGHYYDGDINADCPVCEAERRSSAGMGSLDDTQPAEGGFGSFDSTDMGGGFGGFGATEPAGGGFGSFGATEPAGSSFGSFGATEPVGGGFGSFGATEPVKGGFGFGAAEPAGGGFGFGAAQSAGGGFGAKESAHSFDSDDETMRFVDPSAVGADNYGDPTMPVNPGNTVGFNPVVGWLVCIEGPDRGSDYRIRIGYNQIGRAEHMDICVRGDKKISREKHALIAYDNEEKVFFFGPSEGRNIVRVNDKMVMTPTELSAYDILTIGSSRLIFVPLCGDKFDWGK